ncbi:MAG TPA: GFA family protein, partial [Bradyrhizobium sp.]|nr:GFA family protein [Bradyrhizobium sp.]
MKLTGKCFCGAVEIEASGSPEAMGYCHCRSCRSWSGGPVNAFSLWKPEAVRISSGADNVATFQKTSLSQRQYCKKCGGHLMTNHPPLGLIDVFAATLP